ncbi:VOC family protein [Streptomyces decoyicus]|uniref:VOC family protein n=1 Tax=Streptomyces decoyicus TaxID=249567 RepID=UPI003C12BD40
MTRGSGSEETGSPEAEPPETGSPAVLDHLVHATPDLDRTLAEIAALTGVRPVPGGSHPGRGTLPHSLKGMGGAPIHLLGLGGGAYFEIIGPDPEQPAPDGPRAALGVRWPGEPVTAGPTGLTAVLAGRHGRVAFGRGAVAV